MKKDLYKAIKTYEIPIENSIDDLASYAISINQNYKVIKYLNPWILKNKINESKRSIC